MEHRSLEGRRTDSPWMILLLVIAMMGFWALTNPVSVAGAQTTDDTIVDPPPAPTAAASFAKYDGVDGESSDAGHDKWIDVLSIDWGASKPGGGATGQSRRRGAAIVEDLVITFSYEKASPRLEEKMLRGEVIPKLEIELTEPGADGRRVYLKYELKNVMITSFQVSGDASTGERPVVTMANNFEEVKVTYTEYDAESGNIEYTWKVEKGTK